ncbi:MAG: glycosyl transferase family 1, partial [Pseudomonadota bacterium]
MRVVFAHQNFPAQFGEFGSHLAQLGWDVAFLTAAEGFQPPARTKGVRATANRKPSQEIHSLARPMERAMINGHAMGTAAMKLQKSGFEPDVMVAHSGWGSGSLLKAVWPNVPFVPYIEWFYRSPPTDALNEKERTPSVDQRASAMSRNAPILLDLAQADIAICPTYFQAEQLPERHRGMLRILHDGVDAERNAPDPQAKMQVPGLDLSAAKEVVTYATRGMEPHRGFPEF